MGNPLVHFEFAADDPAALGEFHRGLFDWKIDRWGEGDGASWVINTGAEPGGGLMAWQQPEHTTLMYFDVASIEQYAKKAKALGGTVLLPKTPVGEKGWCAVIADPQGNSFGIWELSPSYQPPAQQARARSTGTNARHGECHGGPVRAPCPVAASVQPQVEAPHVRTGGVVKPAGMDDRTGAHRHRRLPDLLVRVSPRPDAHD
ncbi:MAG: VOC family protein [Armatimonadota bacterium]